MARAESGFETCLYEGGDWEGWEGDYCEASTWTVTMSTSWYFW